MRYRGSLDLDHLLRQPFGLLGRLVPDEDSGWPLPPAEVTARAVSLRAAGYEVMPTCGHYDRRGFCLDHPDRIIGMWTPHLRRMRHVRAVMRTCCCESTSQCAETA